MDKIRVGMIRCDVHASWYALLFAPANEKLLLSRWPQNHYYFYYRYNLKFGLLPGFELTKVWDKFPHHQGLTHAKSEPLGNAEIFAEVFMNRPTICETLEEVSDDVDLVFIANCMEDGRDHLELAAPGLKKGVPTFVDKPFAYTLADARAMIELAKAHDTAVMSASLLRMNPLAEQFKNRFAEIGPVGEGFVKGVGSSGLGATIHGLSLAQHVFGEGVEWVDAMGKIPLEIVRLHYPSPKLDTSESVGAMLAWNRGPSGRTERLSGVDVVVLSSFLLGPNCGYQAIAYSKSGSALSPWIDDYVFPLGGRVILDKCLEMVRTRKPPLPYKSLLELMEIVEAGRLSQKTGKPVSLNEVRESCSVPVLAQ